MRTVCINKATFYVNLKSVDIWKWHEKKPYGYITAVRNGSSPPMTNYKQNPQSQLGNASNINTADNQLIAFPARPQTTVAIIHCPSWNSRFYWHCVVRSLHFLAHFHSANWLLALPLWRQPKKEEPNLTRKIFGYGGSKL